MMTSRSLPPRRLALLAIVLLAPVGSTVFANQDLLGAASNGAASNGAASNGAAGWVETSTRSATGRLVDFAYDREVDIGNWKTFTIVTPRPPRAAGMEARDHDRMLRSAVGVAFAIAGFVYADEGEVDFVVEYALEHPGNPEKGAVRWVRGKKTNHLTIALRRPAELRPSWTGRVYQVLRKKRGHNERDEDAELRVHSAAEAIIDAFQAHQGIDR